MSTRGFFSRGITIDANALIATGAGKVRGASPDVMRALGVDIPVGVFEPISPIAAIVAPEFPLDTGDTLEFVSNNAADVGNLIRFEGLDENFEKKEDVVALNGLTPVVAEGTWTRINNAVVINTEIVGEVAISRGSDGLQISGIRAEEQRSFVAIHSFPGQAITQVLNLIGTMVRDAGGANL